MDVQAPFLHGGSARQRVLSVVLPGGTTGVKRRQVRFEEDPTEVDVDGGDSCATYTSAAGVQRLVAVLREAAEALDRLPSTEEASLAAASTAEVACAIAELSGKCGLELIDERSVTVFHLSKALREMESCFYEQGRDPACGGIW
jgi:hypothetical protein